MSDFRFPRPGEKYVNKGSKRTVLVVGTRYIGDQDEFRGEVDFRYVAGLGGSNLWKRGVTPTQTLSLEDFNRLMRRHVV